MLEVTQKRTVKTRKKHECYGCCKTIDKGAAAVHVCGKEDGRYRSFHLHIHCHKVAMKKNMFSDGFIKGAIYQTAQDDYREIENTSYPF